MPFPEPITQSNRFYVPQRYAGIVTDSRVCSKRYLTTSGVYTCVAVLIHGTSPSGKSGGALMHMDSDHMPDAHLYVKLMINELKAGGLILIDKVRIIVCRAGLSMGGEEARAAQARMVRMASRLGAVDVKGPESPNPAGFDIAMHLETGFMAEYDERWIPTEVMLEISSGRGNKFLSGFMPTGGKIVEYVVEDATSFSRGI